MKLAISGIFVKSNLVKCSNASLCVSIKINLISCHCVTPPSQHSGSLAPPCSDLKSVLMRVLCWKKGNYFFALECCAF